MEVEAVEFHVKVAKMDVSMVTSLIMDRCLENMWEVSKMQFFFIFRETKLDDLTNLYIASEKVKN